MSNFKKGDVFSTSFGSMLVPYALISKTTLFVRFFAAVTAAFINVLVIFLQRHIYNALSTSEDFTTLTKPAFPTFGQPAQFNIVKLGI